MKLIIERKELLAALNVVKSAAAINGGHHRLPILANVLINTFEKSVEFTCTDLNLVLRAKADADIQTKGAITVPVQLLHDLVRGFKDESLTLEVVKDEKQKPNLGLALRVKAGDSDYKLGALSADEFPPVPSLRNAYEIFVPQSTLRSLLAATAFAASADMSRYMLNGSLLRVNGNLTVAATDGRKLAVTSTDEIEKSSKKDRDLIVPTAAITALLRLLDDDDESKRKCRIITAENSVQFFVGDTVLTAKLIEGKYADYQRVIPATKGRGIALDRVELLGALHRCALISEVCRFEFKNQTLTLRAVNRHRVVGEALETLLVSAPEPVKVTLNASHLIAALRAIDADEIQFHAAAEACPVVLKVSGQPWLAVFAQYPAEEKATPPQPQPTAKTNGSHQANGTTKINGNKNGQPVKTADAKVNGNSQVNGHHAKAPEVKTGSNGRAITPATPTPPQRQTTVVVKSIK